MTIDHAVARRTDPGTSWAAARSLGAEHLRVSQQIVLATLRENGPMTDEALVARLEGRLSPSGARTRRAELVAKGYVRDTGKRVALRSRRKAIVWDAVRYDDINPGFWG